jgi:hypothetical protein
MGTLGHGLWHNSKIGAAYGCAALENYTNQNLRGS